jgi:dTDP-4-dehydrorhamnose 3,5-epimerase
MEFRPLPIAGAFLVTPERHEDDRGFFARSWDAEEFQAHGLNPRLAQTSLSLSPRAGTLRGLHYQAAPHEEAKIVTCVRGSIWDVVVDLRPGSATFRRWHAEELTGANLWALYVPEGCAHGFLTTTDDALVLYQISAPHDPAAARGVRWDDPAIGIAWPDRPVVISGRDASYPDVAEAGT